jgi:hypothetical protein
VTDETNISQDDVWDEHLGAVNVPAHWGALFGVLVGGAILMLILIAILGGSGGG